MWNFFIVYILSWVILLKICIWIFTIGKETDNNSERASNYSGYEFDNTDFETDREERKRDSKEREEQRQREQDERWAQIQEQRNRESAERERKKNNIINAYNRGPYTVMVNFESGRTMAVSGQLQGFTSSTVTVIHNKNIKTYNTKGNIIDSRSI